MDGWWNRDIIDPDKLPLMVCLLSFIATFLLTRLVTRSIRAGRGPFRNQKTADGVHIHHAVPGVVSLIVGALMAVDSDQAPWDLIAAVLVGVGVSLVLDEFALILHLNDVYWEHEGRLSVDLVALAAACLSLLLLGFSPIGVSHIDETELIVRLGSIAVLVVHAIIITVDVLKGKHRLALIGLFIPLIALVGALRLARPGSFWFRRWYGPRRQARATAAELRFDRRWRRHLHSVLYGIGGNHRITSGK